MDERITTRAAGPVQAIVLMLPATLAVMASAALAPGLPQLHAAFADVDGEQWLVPMILTLPSLCLIIGSPIAGGLGDRFGRRKLLIGALFVYAIIGMAPLVLDSLFAILLSRVGVGFAEAGALTLSTAMISDHFTGRDRDRWLGYQTAVTAVSAILFVGMTGYLGTYGWRGPFAIYALPLMFAALIVLFTWNRAPSPAAGVRHEPTFAWRPMLPILGVSLFGSMSFYVAQIQSGVALATSGLRDPSTIGLFIAIASLGTLVGALGFRFIVGWSLARLLLLAFALCGSGYGVVALSHTADGVVAGLFTAQLGCGILLPSLLTHVLRDLPAEVRGRGTGLWQGVFSVGQFLSPLSMTVGAMAFGGTLAAFAMFGALNILAALGAGAVYARTSPRSRVLSV